MAATSAEDEMGIIRRDWLSNRDLMLGLVLSTIIINLLGLAFPIAILQVYDRIVPNKAEDTLQLLAMGVGVAIFLETMLRIARSWVSGWADARFDHISSCNIFRHILESQYCFIKRLGTGEQLDKLASLATLKEFHGGQLIITALDIPFIFLFLGLICYLGGKLALVTLSAVLILVLFTYYNSKVLHENLEAHEQVCDRRMNFIVEVLSGIHTVKSMGIEAQMLRRHERLQEQNAENDYKMSVYKGTGHRVGTFVSQMAIIMVVVYGSVLIVNGELTLGTVAACTLLTGRAIQPLYRAAGLWTRLQTVYLTNERLQPILAIPTDYEPGKPKIDSLRDNLELKDVSFRYTEDSPYLLEKVNLVVPFGQAVVIDGRQHNGRSTLLNLIGGLLLPTEGEILIGGKNIHDFDLRDYRIKVGYLAEQGALFEGTILDNMTMYNSAKYYNRAQETAKLIGLNRDIRYMQEGYFTKVGGGTVETVPRGIKQRITIARSLIRRPQILLFDEANTALDLKADAELQRAMSRLKGHCTMFIISNRPSTKSIADVVYRLQDRKLVKV